MRLYTVVGGRVLLVKRVVGNYMLTTHGWFSIRTGRSNRCRHKAIIGPSSLSSALRCCF